MAPVTPHMYVYIYSHNIEQSMDQPGKAANPARGQLNTGNKNVPCPRSPENVVSRGGSAVPSRVSLLNAAEILSATSWRFVAPKNYMRKITT